MNVSSHLNSTPAHTTNLFAYVFVSRSHSFSSIWFKAHNNAATKLQRTRRRDHHFFSYIWGIGENLRPSTDTVRDRLAHRLGAGYVVGEWVSARHAIDRSMWVVAATAQPKTNKRLRRVTVMDAATTYYGTTPPPIRYTQNTMENFQAKQ